MADAAAQPSGAGGGGRTPCDSLVIHGATDEEAPWTLEPQMPVYLLGDDDKDPFVGLVKNMWLEPDGEARCVIRWFYRTTEIDDAIPLPVVDKRFVYLSNHEDENSVDAILSPAPVLFLPPTLTLDSARLPKGDKFLVCVGTYNPDAQSVAKLRLPFPRGWRQLVPKIAPAPATGAKPSKAPASSSRSAASESSGAADVVMSRSASSSRGVAASSSSEFDGHEAMRYDILGRITWPKTGLEAAAAAEPAERDDMLRARSIDIPAALSKPVAARPDPPLMWQPAATSYGAAFSAASGAGSVRASSSSGMGAVEAYVRQVALLAMDLRVGINVGAPHPLHKLQDGSARVWPAVLLSWTPARESSSASASRADASSSSGSAAAGDGAPPPGYATVCCTDLDRPFVVPLEALRLPSEHSIITEEHALRVLTQCNFNASEAVAECKRLIAAFEERRVARETGDAAVAGGRPGAASDSRKKRVAGRPLRDAVALLVGRAELTVVPRTSLEVTFVSAVHEAESHAWTESQQLSFALGLNRFGKNFEQISRLIDGKTTRDCVAFYYRNKHIRMKLVGIGDRSLNPTKQSPRLRDPKAARGKAAAGSSGEAASGDAGSGHGAASSTAAVRSVGTATRTVGATSSAGGAVSSSATEDVVLVVDSSDDSDEDDAYADAAADGAAAGAAAGRDGTGTSSPPSAAREASLVDDAAADDDASTAAIASASDGSSSRAHSGELGVHSVGAGVGVGSVDELMTDAAGAGASLDGGPPPLVRTSARRIAREQATRIAFEGRQLQLEAALAGVTSPSKPSSKSASAGAASGSSAGASIVYSTASVAHAIAAGQLRWCNACGKLQPYVKVCCNPRCAQSMCDACFRAAVHAAKQPSVKPSWKLAKNNPWWMCLDCCPLMPSAEEARIAALWGAVFLKLHKLRYGSAGKPARRGQAQDGSGGYVGGVKRRGGPLSAVGTRVSARIERATKRADSPDSRFDAPAGRGAGAAKKQPSGAPWAKAGTKPPQDPRKRLGMDSARSSHTPDASPPRQLPRPPAVSGAAAELAAAETWLAKMRQLVPPKRAQEILAKLREYRARTITVHELIRGVLEALVVSEAPAELVVGFRAFVPPIHKAAFHEAARDVVQRHAAVFGVQLPPAAAAPSAVPTAPPAALSGGGGGGGGGPVAPSVASSDASARPSPTGSSDGGAAAAPAVATADVASPSAPNPAADPVAAAAPAAAP